MDWILLKRLKSLLLAAAMILAAIRLAGAPFSPVEARDADVQAEQAAPESLQVKGRIVPQRWVYLSFPNSGRVAEILVEEGQSVPAGVMLARLEGCEADAAWVAATQLELLAAQQAIDALHQNAGAALAQAGYTLAEAREAQEKAGWKVRRMKEPASSLRIEQAYANMQLAERGLQKARRDLEKAEKLWNDRRDPAWYFLSRREFRLNLALLSQQVAQAERKYADSVDKYNDLLEPVDEIDLGQAEAGLRVADAWVEQAIRERDKLFNGPRAEDLALAQARLSAAEKALRAASAALAEGQLTAPFAGTVASIPGRVSQWASRGEPVLVLADVTGWKVEIEELKENEVTRLQAGQPVVVRLDALPDLELSGRVESTSWVYQEKDGEVIYSAKIALSGYQPELRWGMTARVEPQAGQGLDITDGE